MAIDEADGADRDAALRRELRELMTQLREQLALHREFRAATRELFQLARLEREALARQVARKG